IDDEASGPDGVDAVVESAIAAFAVVAVDVVPADAADFSAALALDVAGGNAAVWIALGLLPAAGLEGVEAADAGGAAGVAGLSSGIALGDARNRGEPTSSAAVVVSAMFEVVGRDGWAAVPVGPFTSVASTSSSSQSDHASFLPGVFTTTDWAVWVLPVLSVMMSGSDSPS